MEGWTIILIIVAYFAMLTGISWATSRKSDNQTWFSANRSAPWPVVAYGMVGASLSGVTFLSIPGWVATSQFTYMPVVFGYLIGYAVIALVLLPVYYRLNVTSIYEYLGDRFGSVTHKSGAIFFLISRTVGAAFRLYLVALVFQILLQKLGFPEVPFYLPVLVTIGLIFLYTFKGGIKTVVWTDLIQTTFMLLAAVLAFVGIASAMDMSPAALIGSISDSDLSKMFITDWTDKSHFLKQIISGAFIAIAMTGLDQDMMQKNLTCPDKRSSQKNIALFCVVLLFVNVGFLMLGGALYTYGFDQGIVAMTQDASNPITILDPESGIHMPRKTDELFPYLALDFLSPAIAATFLLGLIAAAYSSADSALTGLTTSFCVDFLGLSRKPADPSDVRTRHIVQIVFAIILFIVILIFRRVSEPSVISSIFKAAGYTYGPLLGYFFFGLFMPRKLRPDLLTPLAAVIAVILTWFIGNHFSNSIGFLILPVNGALTFLLLGLFSLLPGRTTSEINQPEAQ